MDFYEKIKVLRLQRGLSLQAVGDIVGVGKSTVRKWENGDIKNMGRDKIELLAKALGVEPGYLMGWDDDDPVEKVRALTTNENSGEHTQPDVDLAATKAAELIIKYNISSAPIDVLHILSSIPGVLVLTFTEWADASGLDRNSLVTVFGSASQDAITFVVDANVRFRYIVAYNQRLPNYMLQMALARELGHIILNHDGSICEDVKTTEALYFARHLLFPRQLIHAIREANIHPTIEMLGNITGCYGRCIAGIRKTPGARVPAELNRQVKAQFAAYLDYYFEYQRIMAYEDDSALADFGTYMDNYQEEE